MFPACRLKSELVLHFVTCNNLSTTKKNVLFFEYCLGLFEELVGTEIRYLRDFLDLMWYFLRSFAVTKVTSAWLDVFDMRESRVGDVICCLIMGILHIEPM